MDLTVDTFDKICRACLCQSTNMKSLFTKLENGDKILVDLFTCIVNINVNDEDNLPKQLCGDCESILNKFEEFKSRCFESENVLKKICDSTKNYDSISEESKTFVDRLTFELDNNTKKDYLDIPVPIDKNELIKKELEIEYDGIDCSTNFDESEPLETFIAENQDENIVVKYECDCGQVFHDIHLYNTHNCNKNIKELGKKSKKGSRTILQTESDGIPCLNCNLKLKNLAAWKSHLKTHEKKEKTETYQCSYCMSKFKSRKTLTRHIKIHQNGDKGKFTCEKCKRDFKYRGYLESHMISVHMHSDFKCDICNQKFDSKEELEAHRDTHKSKKHVCKFCRKAFFMLCTLKDHIRSHTGEKPYLCSTCGKGFSQKNNLAQHTRRHLGLKAFKCDICPKGFVSKGELEAHTRKHSGAHPFVCDDCGNGFTTSSSLVKHRRIHTGERPYACDLCPMKFAASGTLKNHRRTHTGERPYQCSHCDKAFAQRTDLISHIRCHTGERPYVCTQCGLTFRKTANLKAHVKMHGKEAMNGVLSGICGPMSMI